MQETYVYATARVVYLDPSVYLRDFSEPVPNTTLKKTLEDVGGDRMEVWALIGLISFIFFWICFPKYNEIELDIKKYKIL